MFRVIPGARYYPDAGINREFKSVYQLPAGLQCRRCVLQWHYMAANNWGDCGNGTSRNGCGAQEQFRACADIRISDREEPPDPAGPPNPVRPTAATASRTTAAGGTNETPPTSHPYAGITMALTAFAFAVVLITAIIFCFFRAHERQQLRLADVRP